MRAGPLEFFLALLIAGGFGSVGETVLRRASRSLSEWNSSLAAGMGICAALLFPFSLFARARTLDLTLGLMGACAAATVWRRLRLRDRPTRARETESPGRGRVPLVLAGCAAAAFAALDWRYNLLWDGFAVWASKAQRLFVEGRLTRAWYPGESYDSRYASYPALVPLYEALVSRLRGRFDFDGLKPIFLVFWASMAASVFYAVRGSTRGQRLAASSKRLAAWAAAIVALIPALSTQWAAGGYADMPQAAMVAAVVAAGMRSDAAALPWVIGALTTVKPEGMVLALLASAASLAVPLGRKPGPRAAGLIPAAAIVAGFAALRIAYVRWTGVREDTYAFVSLERVISRVPEVLRLCVGELLDARAWGFLWPAFFAAAVVSWRLGDSREKALAAGVLAGVAALAVPFLVTTWPLELHFSQAYFRLLAQLAPAAVIAVTLAYARAREATSPPPAP